MTGVQRSETDMEFRVKTWKTFRAITVFIFFTVIPQHYCSRKTDSDIILPITCPDESVRRSFSEGNQQHDLVDRLDNKDGRPQGGPTPRSNTIHITVLLPSDPLRPFSSDKLRPSLRLLSESFSRWLPCHAVVLSYKDSRCSEGHAMNEAINMYVDGRADAFLGPVCDFAVAPIARQASFWNVPLVSIGAIAHDFFAKRSISYSTLTRAGSVNLRGLSDGMRAVMKRYGWKRLKLIYERNGFSEVLPPFCHLAAEYIVQDWQSRRRTGAPSQQKPGQRSVLEKGQKGQMKRVSDEKKHQRTEKNFRGEDQKEERTDLLDEDSRFDVNGSSVSNHTGDIDDDDDDFIAVEYYKTVDLSSQEVEEILRRQIGSEFASG